MIYLDYASTTPVDEEVLQSYQNVLSKYFANSESLYSLGVEAANLLEKSRQQTASLLSVAPNEVIFTSGASEANSLAIKGVAFKYQKYGKHLITTKIEHSSVLHTFEQLETLFGFEVTYLGVDVNGLISLEELKQALRKDTILCSIMWVNNEIGTIEPIEEIVKLVKNLPRCFLHVDAVQAVGKIPIDLSGIDLVTFSAHKIYGLKGSGVLVKKQNIQLVPLISGGQQEQGIRGGTSNVAVHIAFAKALRLALEKQKKRNEHVRELNLYLREGLDKLLQVVINSPVDASPYILSFSCLKLPSEVHLNALDSEGVYVSAQSTCGSKSKMSYVLEAMNLPSAVKRGVIRISLSYQTTYEEIDVLLTKVEENMRKYGV